jgi:hypothetical protein
MAFWWIFQVFFSKAGLVCPFDKMVRNKRDEAKM